MFSPRAASALVRGAARGWRGTPRVGGGAAAGQRRALSLHEYQSQAIMREAGVAVPRSVAVKSVEEAREAVATLTANPASSPDVVVKAQVLAGGRGLGSFTNGFKGGVHTCYSAASAVETASKMLGGTLVTKQTGARGRPCNTVMLAERVYLRREMYFAILYDRESQGPVIIASAVGGTSIEDIAAANPDAIVKVPVDLAVGLQDADASRVAAALGFVGDSATACAEQVRRLYDMFLAKDATLLEVNPMAETPTGKVVCLDAKISFDDNASFRQAAIFEQRDTSQEEPREVAADAAGLNYIGLDGNIACMVNGAGLAMATMDIIKLHGGEPANFLDVGGGATEEQVTAAFRILNEDTAVRAILVNIFGGIMRCDVIAQGIINAAQTLDLRVPVIVRLQGNKVEEAKALIAKSGLRIIANDDLDAAARTAVKVAQIVDLAAEAHVGVSFTATSPGAAVAA
ncbi:hypothetical protein MMPV_004286 [Pyropia vietnamensis]